MTMLGAEERRQQDRPRNTRILLWVIYGVFTAVCIAGVTILLTHYQGIPFSRVVGLVFLLFGIFKMVLAYDAYHAPRALAPESDQRAESGQLFRLWLSYKMLPGILAIGVGIFALVHGIHYIDRMTLVRF